MFLCENEFTAKGAASEENIEWLKGFQYSLMSQPWRNTEGSEVQTLFIYKIKISYLLLARAFD